MANNLSSNITRKVMRAFLPAFEKQRVLSKTVDTQTFQGNFNPSSGQYVDIKRPHQYNSVRTSGGDISSATWNEIISGKATAQVQNYITVPIPWTNKEEALELDQLEKILAPAAETAVIELETSFCDYMIANAGLLSGVPGQALDAWSDIAKQKALMDSIGVPAGQHYSVINPHILANLADVQTGLSADPSRLVQTAWENAQISSPFAGLRVVSSNSLSTYTSSDGADRAGTFDGAPDLTYVTAKDTMKQVWPVTGFQASMVVKAGDIVTITGKYYVNMRTGKVILDAAGAPIKFSAVVTEDVTLGVSGDGDLVVAGPALFETNGQYNTVDSAIAGTEVVTIVTATATVYQPNLFYHESAFAIAFVKLPKLFSTDTVATTSDGVSIRVSKYSDGDANTQKLRFDILPAFGTMNPFFAGKGFGYA